MTRDELMQKAFDAIVEAEETDSLKALFLDGWGTAVVEKGHVWMKERIRGRYAAA